MDLMIIASLVVFCLVMILAYRHVQRKQQKDSALRQKAVLNSNAQLIFSRVKSALPQAYVLAHVSFDALLTTKYLHTRREYQKMVADFVVLDQDYRVIAVLALGDLKVMKRSKTAAFQNAAPAIPGRWHSGQNRRPAGRKCRLESFYRATAPPAQALRGCR